MTKFDAILRDRSMILLEPITASQQTYSILDMAILDSSK